MTNERTTYTIVPAAPGWFVALFIPAGAHGGDEWAAYLDLEPIIAWEIERTDQPYHPIAKGPSWERCISHGENPLTNNGNMNDTANDWGIKAAGRQVRNSRRYRPLYRGCGYCRVRASAGTGAG